MKFLSPVFLRQSEFHAVKMGLNRRANPIQASVALHGIVPFVPVKVTRYDGLRFDPMFIGKNVPLLDIIALKNGSYPFIYNEDGILNEALTSGTRVKVLAQVDTHHATLEVPLGLANGDIILASGRYPPRELY